MAKASRSGRVLRNGDAALIKSMIARGDRQHDIAAYFGVNGGRVGEISRGATFPAIAPAAGSLPPSPPYLVIEAAHTATVQTMRRELARLGAGAALLTKVDKLITAMQNSERARDGV